MGARNTKLGASSILINAAKCPTKSNRKPSLLQSGLALVLVSSIRTFFSYGVFASLRSRTRTKLSVLCDQYFTPKAMVKSTRGGRRCGDISRRLLRAGRIK